MQEDCETKLGGLKEKLLLMAGYAEQAVRHAMKAVSERDDDLARRVQEDDRLLDRFEMDLDDKAISLLGLTQVPKELRLITVAMKITHDLERVGDEATTIARRSMALSQEPPLVAELELPKMATMALDMLKQALDSFVHVDTGQARAIILQDKQVDALNKRLQAELIGMISHDTSNLNRCLHLMTICKSLERIADHAKNIAQQVVFLYEAQDIRHPASMAR